ncbi:MAG: ABC transporter permease, partial [Deltaproteobacteria bacterium]|nr:ABC transporter permease [Deltaproteobacteria bacterium]
MRVSRIRAVARKEVYHLLRDFRSLSLAFVIPFVLILLFGYALSLDVDNITVVAVDHENTELSRDLIRKIDASSYFNVFRRLPNTKTVVRYLDHGWTTMAVVIPPGWTETMKGGGDAELQVLLDGSDPNNAAISRGYLLAFIADYNRQRRADFFARSGMNEIKTPIEGRVRVWFNEDLESRRFIVPGIIAVIIMIVGALLTSLVIAREYENGTMETLRTLPLHAEEFILGKAIPYFFIGMIDVLGAVLMGQLLFGVVIKSAFWLMVLASALYLLVALSLGLLISVVTKSQLVANQVAVLITYLPSLLLSNFVFPVVNMPKALQVVTYIVPATYYIDILNGLYLRGIGLEYLWPSFVVLVLMCGTLVTLNIVKL